jgi:rubrerythrin
MPDRDVKTIRHLIYYQYAKIVAKSAMGENAKKESYGFIKSTFRKFVNSEKHWSDILREDKQFIQSEKRCIYCGSDENLTWEHIVPKSLKINERCPECDRIQGVHNMIWACSSCNSKKGTKGVYHFYKENWDGKGKMSDLLPALLEKKYLKTIFFCHVCNGTIDSGDLDGDGEITVMDLDEYYRK